jgi:peptide deformylase
LPDGGEKPLRLKIVQAGDPVLREAAQPLTTQDILKDEVQRLIRDMRETMRDAPGVGLAAPQVGLSIQLAVVEDREEFLKSLSAEELARKGRRPVPFHVLINPQIVREGDDRIEFYEGCLSLAGFSAIVPRTLVRVEYLDERENRAALMPPDGGELVQAKRPRLKNPGAALRRRYLRVVLEPDVGRGGAHAHRTLFVVQ